ncbi:hypothetical protein COL60_12140 [Bacillus pseudomycoides]|uniref:glycosyltransferase family 4 protein n=1 Tax=Bacillus pseudomycoides TaxID=64104 RepID=UPI000BEBC1CC|nr:glycosyltransferase family 4 protein [Bacillus pseudomycoides]PEA84138.1 hypothetical protein CON99_08035 [Bacillus pseudomycoides]PFZ10031.1 hypothetical protein COL60_12140 [Bacillus pseudomycoides]PFZ11284.1 hypothetical protein COL63_17565 [Bacillus pseudomycoides]
MKINVLTVSSDLSVKGGITSVVKEITESISSKEINMRFLATHINGNPFKKIFFYIRALFRLFFYIKRYDIGIVHMHMSYRGSFYRKYFVYKISKLLRCKVVLHLHGSEFEIFYNTSSKLSKYMIVNLLDNVDVIIVLGDSWKSVISSIAPKSNVVILKNAVQLVNKSVKFNADNIRFLFLGALIKRKGIYDLIEAIKELDLSGFLKRQNIKFLIAGEGIESNDIRELTKNYHIEEYIELLGWIKGSEKSEVLASTSVLILPSYNEGLPVAILEAMNYGIPVISTNVGSIGEVVKTNDTGVLIKPGDINGLVSAIKEIIQENKWNKMSIECKKIIKENHNSENFIEEIKTIYKMI